MNNCMTKFDNLEKFQEIHKVSKWTEEIQNLDRSITNNEIEKLFKTLQLWAEL